MRKQTSFKRTLTLILTLIMVLSIGTTSFATTTEDETGCTNDCGDGFHAAECPLYSDPEPAPAMIASFSSLDENVLIQNFSIGTSLAAVTLPASLEAADQNGAVSSIEVTWECSPQFDSEQPGEYVFTPILPSSCQLADTAVLPAILVQVQEPQQEQEKEQAQEQLPELEQEIAVLSESPQNMTNSNFKDVIAAVTLNTETEITLVLQEDIIDSGSFSGIEGKHITLTSSEGNIFSIKDMGTELIGDITLDHVKAYDANSRIYANGHVFEATENFQSDGGKIGSLYGGGSKGHDVTGDTNLILRSGIRFAWVYGGGMDSDVDGSTNILIDNVQTVAGNLRGGGMAKDTPSGTVQGDTNIILRQGKADYLFGGGENQNSSATREPARVYGDVHITTGYEGAASQTAWIGSTMSSNGGSIKSTVSNVNFTMLEGTLNYSVNSDGSYSGGSGGTQGAGDCDDVLGTINITVRNAQVNTLNGGGYRYENNKTDGYHSRILNQQNDPYAVHIIWDNPPELDAVNKGKTIGIVGSGYQANNDWVNGDILVEYRSGDLDFIQSTHISNSADLSTIDGNFEVLVTGGRAAYLRGSVNNYKDSPKVYISRVIFDRCDGTEIGYLQYMDNTVLQNKAVVVIDSNLFPQFGSVQKPFYSVAGVEVQTGCTLTTAAGQSWVYGPVIVDGTWEQKYINGSNYNDLYVTGPLTLEGGTLISHGRVNAAGDVTAAGGQLIFRNSAFIQGSLQVDGTEIRLPVMMNGANYPSVSIPLWVKGDASGTSDVYTMDALDWSKDVAPIIGDNYIRTLGKGKAFTFQLANADAIADGLYFKILKDADVNTPENDMWQVAKRITVTFDKNGGNAEANPNIVHQEFVAGTTDYFFDIPGTEPTRSGYTFKGWNMSADGSGPEFSRQVPVTGNLTVYAQWNRNSGNNDGGAGSGSEPETPVKPDEPQRPEDPGKTEHQEDSETVKDPEMPAQPQDAAKPEPSQNKATDSIPQTGDESNSAMWLTLFGISVIGMAVTLLLAKKGR